MKNEARADRAALRQQLLDSGRTFDDVAAKTRVTLITSRATDLRRVLDRGGTGPAPAAELADDPAQFERTAS